MIESLYIKLLRSLGPTRLENLLLELDKGNTYILVDEFHLSRADISRVRMHSTPLLTYHIKEGKKALEVLLAA